MTSPHLRSVFLVILSAVLALGACGPRGFASFSLGYAIEEQQVAGSPLGGVLGSALDVPIPLEIDLATETASRDTGPAQHVYLSELRLDVTATAEPAPDTDDFDFIDSIDIFVESSQSGSTLPRQRVAFLEAVPRGARSISLSLEDVDLIEYVREGARLTSTATGTVPPDDVTFDGDLSLAVEVLP